MGMKEDLDLYWKAMKNGNSSLALLIERKYELDGYPPDIVTTVLSAVVGGKNMDIAIDEALGL